MTLSDLNRILSIPGWAGLARIEEASIPSRGELFAQSADFVEKPDLIAGDARARQAEFELFVNDTFVLAAPVPDHVL